MKEFKRVWAEINLDSVAYNMNSIREKLHKNTEIMAIVKADGYGHGSEEVAKVALYNGATSLGVAICDEGVALRQNNIHTPVLILGYTPQPKLIDVIKHNLTQTVFSLETAKEISDTALLLKSKAQIHIKIDTGMSRLGFTPTPQTIREIKTIADMPAMEIKGVYTHFAQSDLEDGSFTVEQYQKFTAFIKELEENGVKVPSVHACNSGGLLNFREYQMDIVRPGIMLYGLRPSHTKKGLDISLRPAMSIKSQVSYVKKLGKGVSVGYGRSFYTERETTVATIPVGYADGYSRAMGNTGRVLIGGKTANIVGNICMDQFMVDITDIGQVKTADEVVLMGVQGHEEITADEIAGIQNTINYEIVCNIGKRVPRTYLKNGEIIKTVNFI